jgi:hypothetical protein
MLEVVCTTQASVNVYEATRCNIPEDSYISLSEQITSSKALIFNTLFNSVDMYLDI